MKRLIGVAGILGFVMVAWPTPMKARTDVHSIRHKWKSGGVYHYSAVQQVEESLACEYWGHTSLGFGQCSTSGYDSLHPGISISESMVEIP